MTKEKLTKRKMCIYYADEIHKTSLTLQQITSILDRIWTEAYGEGYTDSTTDQKKMRDASEQILKRGFNQLRTEIEDKIYQNK